MLNLIFAQIWGILLYHQVKQRNTHIFREQHAHSIAFQPFCEVVITIGNLTIDFNGDFDYSLRSQKSKPSPKLRHSANRIVVAVGVYQRIRIEEVHQFLHCLNCRQQASAEPAAA